MMGTNHAISGAAAWVAITSTAPSFPALGLIEVVPWQMAAGAVVCAGAALLPDADHHNATIAHSVPVAGKVAAGAVGTLSGGHRKGMHSILAIIGCWYLTGWLGTLTWTPEWWDRAFPVAAAIVIAATLTFAVKTLRWVKSWGKAWLIGIAASAALFMALPDQMGWFQLCITVGFCAHIVGDFLTVEGINWFWPLNLKAPKFIQALPVINKVWKANGYFALPILGKTGKADISEGKFGLEYVLGAVLAMYTLVGLAVNVLGIAL